jgi:ABC-2 type transport system ATP-binding protein
VIFLDEPTNGLDPEGIAEMRALIQRLNRERGITVLFCSHLLSEVEQLCDRVAILNQGRLLFTGRWQELRPEGLRYRIEIELPESARPLLLGVKMIADHSSDAAPGTLANGMRLLNATIELAPGADIADFVESLVGHGARVRAVEPRLQTLEQLYLEKTTQP